MGGAISWPKGEKTKNPKENKMSHNWSKEEQARWPKHKGLDTSNSN